MGRVGWLAHEFEGAVVLVVGEDDGGVVDEGAGDGDALFLAAGELVGTEIGAVAEADSFEGDGGQLAGVAAGDAGEGDVLGGGQGAEEVEVLEHESEVAGPE